ncbi:hypothetical protein BH10ACI3_BH10ACI3_09660 [soil metagenome]
MSVGRAYLLASIRCRSAPVAGEIKESDMLNTLTTEISAPAFCTSPGKVGFADNLVKPRVLLVDDSPTVRKMFSLYLSPGYHCEEAGSFDEALDVLRADDFDVVITDIIMPGLSGIELLRKIVEEFPNIAVIVVSGVDRPQRALDAIRLGAFDYIIKPCDAEVLEITVERAIQHRELLVNAQRSKLALETKNNELVNGKVQVQQLQTQIVQNAKMASLGQLAAGVAHELNNPVGFVHANLEILDQYFVGLTRLMEFYDEAEISAADEAVAAAIKNEIGYPTVLEDVNSIVKDCRDGSDRIRDIVQNLRTFSRLDEAEYDFTNVEEGIDSTLRLISGYFSSGKITLVREYGDIPPIEAFSGQLNQVWMNLLVNAAQSIGQGKGEVKIKTRANDDDIFVEISDDGCGIAVQDLNRIFDPFFTTKPVGEGTGLGLSISFGIVERHGGSISVDTRLNQGTTFQIRLPRHFESTIVLDEKSIMAYSKV